MDTVDWQAQQEELGARLRALRSAAGITGSELARVYDWQQSKVSRLETGRYQATADDISKWVRACGGTDADEAALLANLETISAAHRDWKRRMKQRGGTASVQTDYIELVRSSDVVCHFETAYVPGLLQTAPYAEHVLTEGAGLVGASQRDVSAAVAARMQRQKLLYEPGRQFEFLLAEPVLRWRTAPPNVMRGQLHWLQSVIGLPNVRFGILPMGTQLRLMPQNAFVIYGKVVMVETFVGEWTHTGDEAKLYRRVLATMWADAVESEEARAMLVAAAEALPADAEV